MQRTMSLALIALAAAVFATPAAAQNAHAYATVSVPVSYADLDLEQVSGARTLLSRIDAAADEACGGRPSTRELALRAEYRACVRQAQTKAVSLVARPIVTAEHLARGGRSAGAAVASLQD